MDTSSSKSFQLVSLVGYLIGIPREVFDREELNHSVFDLLDEKPEAKIIRCLCSLRNSLLKDFDTIYNKMLYELKNLFLRKKISNLFSLKSYIQYKSL